MSQIVNIFLAAVIGMFIGATVNEFKNDDSMRHSWIIEHMDCRETGETRQLLGVTEFKWDCAKQDAFWRSQT